MVIILFEGLSLHWVEQIIASDQLEHHAGETPDVCGFVVVAFEDDFGRAVFSSLDDVGVVFVHVACISHVTQFHRKVHLFDFLHLSTSLCFQLVHLRRRSVAEEHLVMGSDPKLNTRARSSNQLLKGLRITSRQNPQLREIRPRMPLHKPLVRALRVLVCHVPEFFYFGVFENLPLHVVAFSGFGGGPGISFGFDDVLAVELFILAV